MKTKITILVIIGILLSSCAPETATQEIEVATEVPITEAPVTQEPIATEPPTEAPTEPPLACVTLLTPINGVDIPPIGKVTFSWTPIDGANSYLLNIRLPAGDVFSVSTDKTFHDRYMEDFVAGGEYKWWVVAQSADRSDICVSEVAIFDKPAYEIGDLAQYAWLPTHLKNGWIIQSYWLQETGIDLDNFVLTILGNTPEYTLIDGYRLQVVLPPEAVGETLTLTSGAITLTDVIEPSYAKQKSSGGGSDDGGGGSVDPGDDDGHVNGDK